MFPARLFYALRVRVFGSGGFKKPKEQTMKIKYEFADGTINEVEVCDELGGVISDLDRQEYNINHRHNRRCLKSYEDMVETGGQVDTERQVIEHTVVNRRKHYQFQGSNILNNLICEESAEHIRNAIRKLKPEQKDLIISIYYKGMSVNDYAKREGVDHSAISHRLQTVYKNLKKLL
ncbi:MAG: hypothetical protein PHU23_13420 [Dehalococcoidales bacterium]|nr:hypothetical protein [Dehalococcoidales bacterium]